MDATRLESGETLLPNLLKRRSHAGEPSRLFLSAHSAPPTTAQSPSAPAACEHDARPLALHEQHAHKAGQELEAAAASAVAGAPLTGGHAYTPLMPPVSAPPAGKRGGSTSLFPELQPSAGAVFFDDLADALRRLQPEQGMPTRRLALHKVARLLGEVPDGADSSRLGAVMASADALFLLVSILRDAYIADCDTSDVWLLHCALALCVNLACHDPDAIVREAGLGPFVLSGLSSANERTRMLCAAGAHNIASSLDGAALVLETHTRKRLEELARADNLGAAHHARAALSDAERLQGGGRVALVLARASLGVLGFAIVLVVLIFLFAFEHRATGAWGLSPLRHTRRALSMKQAPPPRVCLYRARSGLVRPV
ncbi:hypothetical protein KFE25_002561 [Diacronema lutheri]|uniref:Uncharacterized protein n=1 Tax=Diacronema lutheri TaxID=2081491 RepID=A0A8J5XED0_DIALT|nr:hypothetical protein KFE25_002561 [Diacronema lutheri]